MRVALIGDVHGCPDELEELVKKLKWESLDEIRHVGDLVDRGPDSGAVVQFCREAGIAGVMGNHESVLIERKARLDRKANVIFNPEKDATIASIRSSLDWDYLRCLPHLHVYDDIELVAVHGGLWPGLALHAQPPKAVQAVQLIHSGKPVGQSKWWGRENDGTTEDQNRQAGWRRWYEVADEPYWVCYGHSVYPEPFVHGRTVGIDTGCVFGGRLSAAIFPEVKFISVEARRPYYERRKV